MAKRMGWRKDGAQYEDLDDRNVGPTSPNSSEMVPDEPEVELTSVSVIPDGEFCCWTSNIFCANYFINTLTFSFRYIYGNTSSQCIRFWQVSSQTVIFYGIILDGRQHGNDHIEYFVSCSSLQLAHHQVPAGSDHHRKFLQQAAI